MTSIINIDDHLTLTVKDYFILMFLESLPQLQIKRVSLEKQWDAFKEAFKKEYKEKEITLNDTLTAKELKFACKLNNVMVNEMERFYVDEMTKVLFRDED